MNKRTEEVLDEVKKNLIERKVFVVNPVKERYLKACRGQEERERSEKEKKEKMIESLTN